MTNVLREFCYIPEIDRLIVCGHGGVLLYKDYVTGLDENNKEWGSGVNVKVSPNPAMEYISFRINGLRGNSCHLSIFSNSSQEMLKVEDVENGTLRLKISAFPRGLYHYSLMLDGRQINSGSFIKK